MKNGVEIIKWIDNKPVHVVSTAAGEHPMGSVSRYDRKTKTKINVNIPRAIELYNSNMGGVDLHDMLVQLHRSPTRSRSWYYPIIGYCIDLAVVNSWFLYKRQLASIREVAPAEEK